MPSLKARKRFGQHFLRDPLALEEIAALIDPKPEERLLEIGPGRGALTEHLLAACPSMCALEIDRDLCRYLKDRFPHLNLIEGDVLSLEFERLISAHSQWRLVGNLPYNISTPLLARVCALAPHIHDAWFLLQREVANRLVAEPGTRDWSRLSVLVRLRFQVEIELTLEPESFSPAPKVTSSLVHLQPNLRDRGIISMSALEEILLQAFSQRRKTLRNALYKFPVNWSQISVNPSKRPDQIGIDAYIEIANQLAVSAARDQEHAP